MHRIFLLTASIAAFLAIGLGAFGAHGLRGRIDESMLAIYQTAVQYHTWHALGLGLVAVLARDHPRSRLLVWSGGLMAGGILVFSGSLYGLALSGVRWLGAITPLGGVAFLGAWLLLAVFAWKQPAPAADPT
jgi:uncharacterized membrane protein YgdD (TMEM256/DUF423 family)